jgi:hypothetical protein
MDLKEECVTLRGKTTTDRFKNPLLHVIILQYIVAFVVVFNTKGITRIILYF